MKIKEFKLSTFILTNATKYKKLHVLQDLALHGIILDLKEGLFENQKELLRKELYEYLTNLDHQNFVPTLGLRINPLNTKIGFADFYQYLESSFNLDFLVLSNIKDGNIINFVTKLLQAYRKSTLLILSIDGPEAISNLKTTLNQANLDFVYGLVIANDTFVLKSQISLDSSLLKYAKMELLTEAKKHQLLVLEGPSFETNNLELLLNSTLSSKSDGFNGRLVNHPRHLAIINQVYCDHQKEIKLAQALEPEAIQKHQPFSLTLRRLQKIFKVSQ